jgi:hypothetical protein
MLQCATTRPRKTQDKRIDRRDSNSFLLQNSDNRETFYVVSGNNHDTFCPINACTWHLLADARGNICVRTDHIPAL